MGNYKVCCCFGHREVLVDISSQLEEVVRSIVERGCTVFMVGGNGVFDDLFSRAVRKVKEQYPYIVLELIKPYFSNTWNEQKEVYMQLYDHIVVPSELDGLHYKAAIFARNCWMIDRADVIVAFLNRDFGGAYTAVRYAMKKHKDIVYVK